MSNIVKESLIKIVATNGLGIAENFRRVEALLKDMCPHEKRYISILSRALADGIGRDLLAYNPAMSTQLIFPRLIKRLEDNLALTPDAAKEAVEIWADILWGKYDGVSDVRSGDEDIRYELSDTRPQSFKLLEGIVIFSSTYRGSGNFTVELLNEEKRHIALVANAIGATSIRKSVGITEAGLYTLKVWAAGPWEIEITQHWMPPNPYKKPFTFSGKGQDSSHYIDLPQEDITLWVEHTGRSNFTVKLLSFDGKRSYLLVNEIGDCQTSIKFRMPVSGSYVFDVSADGAWVIEVKW